MQSKHFNLLLQMELLPQSNVENHMQRNGGYCKMTLFESFKDQTPYSNVNVPDISVRLVASPGEKPLCTLMAPGACKIRRGCNVLQVPIQIIPLGVKSGGTVKLFEHLR